MAGSKPVALLDRVLSISKDPATGEPRAEALRRVPEEEPFFHGHFPGMPVAPGVFLVEALAECARRALDPELDPDRTESAADLRLVGVTGVRFRRRVTPGDEIHLTAVRTGRAAGRHVFRATGAVRGQRAVEATLALS